MSFRPEARKSYTLRQLAENGMEHMKSEGVATETAINVSNATLTALLLQYGPETVVPGAVNDLLGRSLVQMIGSLGTIDRVVVLMKEHNNDVMKVYRQLEEEGLLLASPALYEDQ